jgi:hypothetical protein
MISVTQLSEAIEGLTAAMSAMRGVKHGPIRKLLERYQVAHTMLFERHLALHTTIEFLLSTQRELGPDGPRWLYHGELIDPPDDVKACIAECEGALKRHAARVS